MCENASLLLSSSADVRKKKFLHQVSLVGLIALQYCQSPKPQQVFKTWFNSLTYYEIFRK